MIKELAYRHFDSLSFRIANHVIKEVKENFVALNHTRPYFREQLVHKFADPMLMINLKWASSKMFQMNDMHMTFNKDIEEICVSYAVIEADHNSVSADNVPLISGHEGLHLNIIIDGQITDFHEQEIKNSVRHEIEHLIQSDYTKLVERLDYYKIKFNPIELPSHFCLYLTQPSEVAAHVRGYQFVTKNDNEFIKIISEHLELYRKNDFLTHEEKSVVFWCWKDWHDRNRWFPFGGSSE